MKKWLFLLAMCLAASACSTMKGLGQDIEKGGEALQKAADK